MSDQLPPAPPPPPDSPNQPPYGQPPYGQPGNPYGQQPGYPRYPGGGDPYAGMRIEPQLQLDVHGLRDQKRWTVLIRLILAIPQLIIAYFLMVAGFFVIIVGWFAALFTGRLPEGIRDFLIGVLRYQVRVHGYVLLLVDEYPPFMFFDAPGYPIQIEVPAATALNPAAVLFRIILMIPAWVLSVIVMEGWGVIAFFVWVIMLFKGRQPEPVFGATSAALRFETRFLGYAGMLTPTYPKGLFGEVPGAAERVSPTRPLLLSSGARVLLIIMIVLGAIAWIWSGSWNNGSWNMNDSQGPAHSVSQPR
ncbi:DUF4389 domain-containing protein [Catenulispora subtropica]|uniref:DUF4389 domain-containing protein n=1 Tax=Catenulispora subtropica TaxID=450798 RepID=A0ABP5CC81_9ACTN